MTYQMIRFELLRRGRCITLLMKAITVAIYLGAGKSAQIGARNGGDGGIRTHERVAPLHTFQACAFDHSATAPHCRLEAAASNVLSVLSQAAALCQSVTHEKTLPRRPRLRPHLAVLRSVCAGRAGCVSIARRDRGTGACVRMGGDRAGGFAGNGAVGGS